jgi:hypothetical protein
MRLMGMPAYAYFEPKNHSTQHLVYTFLVIIFRRPGLWNVLNVEPRKLGTGAALELVLMLLFSVDGDNQRVYILQRFLDTSSTSILPLPSGAGLCAASFPLGKYTVDTY